MVRTYRNVDCELEKSCLSGLIGDGRKKPFGVKKWKEGRYNILSEKY